MSTAKRRKARTKSVSKSKKKKAIKKAAKRETKKAVKRATKSKAPKPAKPTKAKKATKAKIASKLDDKGSGKARKKPTKAPTTRKKGPKKAAKRSTKKSESAKLTEEIKKAERKLDSLIKQTEERLKGQPRRPRKIKVTDPTQKTKKLGTRTQQVVRPQRTRGKRIVDTEFVTPVVGSRELTGPSPVPRARSPYAPDILAPNIYLTNIEKFQDFSEDDKPGEKIERYRTSTKGMHRDNENYFAVFEKAFVDFMGKTPMNDPDDIPFFRWGLSVRSVGRRSPKQVIQMERQFTPLLQNILPEGASAHIVNEGSYISVDLNLGSYREATTYSEVLNVIKDEQRGVLHEFIAGVREIMEDFVWFEFWDTEENFYE